MTGYCAKCGWHRLLDALTCWCAPCITEWGEAFNATAGRKP